MLEKTHYNYSEMIDQIVKHGEQEGMEELAVIMADAMTYLKEHDEGKHHELWERMRKLAEPVHLTEHEATEYVKHIKHKDGTVGEKYRYAHVEELMDKSAELAKHNINDVYFALNKIHSVFYKKTWDKDTYIMLTEMYFDDPEHHESKVREWAISCYGELEHEHPAED